jgi:hypothetical protein
MASLLSSQIWAQGNVLLPTDSSNNTPPNLGLIPAEIESPPPIVKSQPAPAIPPDDQPQAAKPSSPIPPTLPATPAPIQTTPPIMNPGKPPVAAHTITITLAKPFLAPTDIENIHTQLGIPKNMVATECQLGINGTLLTDQGAPPVESNALPTVNVPYDGLISNAILAVYAACTSAPKPIQFNYIQQIAGRYALALSSTYCMPNATIAANANQILITHTGSGSDSCTYQ